MKRDCNSNSNKPSGVDEAVNDALGKTYENSGASPKEIFLAACVFAILGFLLVNAIPVTKSGVLIGYALMWIGIPVILLLHRKI